MLATDYILTRPTGVESLILAGPCLSIPRYIQDVARLRKELPAEIQEIMVRHEAAATTDSEEYRRAGMAFLRKHVCRLDPWPCEMELSLAGMGGEVYNTMWGPSEFYATGPLKSYDRTPRLGELRLPVLFTAGRFDECTPSASAWYQGLVPGSRLAIFENSSHMTMIEESEAYIGVLRGFLRDVERRGSFHR
jgi:proline iminopeptidase